MTKRSGFQIGNKIRIVSYNPFRGLTGTIRTIHKMSDFDEPFCLYLIDLDGSHIKEAVWFHHEEVESVSSQEFEHLQRIEQA